MMLVSDLRPGLLVKTVPGRYFFINYETWLFLPGSPVTEIPIAWVVKDNVNSYKSGVYLGRKVTDMNLGGTHTHYQFLINGEVCKVLGKDIRWLEEVNEREISDKNRHFERATCSDKQAGR